MKTPPNHLSMPSCRQGSWLLDASKAAQNGTVQDHPGGQSDSGPGPQRKICLEGEGEGIWFGKSCHRIVLMRQTGSTRGLCTDHSRVLQVRTGGSTVEHSSRHLM